MMVLNICLVAGAGSLTTRYRWRVITKIAKVWLSFRKNDAVVGERVIIVGSGEGTEIASWLLHRQMFRAAFSLVGVVDHVNPIAYGMKVNGHWMLGSISDLPALIKKNDIGVILSTLPRNSVEVQHLIALKKELPIHVIFLKDLMRIVEQQVKIKITDSPIWLDEHLEYTALQDDLTELPSWTLFQDRLNHSLALAKRNNTQPGFLFMEFNGLHFEPGSLGHNSLLKEVAHRLNSIKRESDTLTRMSNNMFVLLLENMPDNNFYMDKITKRIYDAISVPFEIKGDIINIEISIYIHTNTDTSETRESPKNVNIAGLSFTKAKKPEFDI